MTASTTAFDSSAGDPASPAIPGAAGATALAGAASGAGSPGSKYCQPPHAAPHAAAMAAMRTEVRSRSRWPEFPSWVPRPSPRAASPGGRR